tara:strand:- start:510 stop:836 length:327 start_codon:yes stop_codon:yes gene_type:complete
MANGRYIDLMKGEKVMYAEKFWDILNVSYSSNSIQSEIFKTPMSFWLKQLDKIQEDYIIIPININLEESQWERSIFDILHKRLNKFLKGEKVEKVYTYTIINEIVIEP